ncbi:MAG: ArsA family ATPase [Marinomonas atlantica]|nr:ArsA family ATPase [Marinomonas atlantica]
MMSSITDKRLILIGGHHGVGKTTLAAALALLLSRRGQRVLVISVDSANSLSDAFDWQIGEVGAAVCAGVHALEIAPSAAVKTYTEGGFAQQKPLSEWSPELIEIAVLERIGRLIDDAEEYYDTIILDWAPSDYALRLLNNTSNQDESGSLHEQGSFYQRSLKRFQDVENTALLLAITPDKRATCASKRIFQTYKENAIPLFGIVVNRVLPADDAGEFFAQRRVVEQKYLNTIEQRFTDCVHYYLPLMETDIHGIGPLQTTAVLLETTGL